MNKIPIEILQEILQYLSNKEIVQVSQVCRLLDVLCKELLIKRELCRLCLNGEVSLIYLTTQSRSSYRSPCQL
jgi:hypothetical protein